ncbi:mannose-6-phosphate isomerase, class I [Kitasatospora sp. NPDC091335]|uniref:mannose-6-phosphate isomerase, class I n=1 Tax=Kitasatospora sp. NPDC091335 TaxID=3364085 RepID=UPI0038207028
MPPFSLLLNPVRRYAWGSPTAIPALTGTAPDGTPQAELWLGAHPSAPSLLTCGDDGDDGPRQLDRLIAADPDGMLGADTVRRFGPALPFLFKVLAADRALSLQVHPTRAQAEAGYAAEQALGIPLDAPERVFKDRGHKPELICALGDFEALCGFRPAAGTARLLDALGVLPHWAAALRSRPAEAVLPGLLRAGLDATDGELAAVTEALRRAAALGDTAASDGPYAVEGPDAASCAAYARLADEYPGDRGLLAALLLNHVRLTAGQALHLDAGVPHAYLRGVGVELMANSDNVLRCGLTPKHVDTDGLTAVTSFRAGVPEVLAPIPAEHGFEGFEGFEEEYPTPAAEFRLSRLRPGSAAARVDLATPQILLCVSGQALLRSPGGAELPLPAGSSAYLRPCAGPVELTGPGARLFRATTG